MNGTHHLSAPHYLIAPAPGNSLSISSNADVIISGGQSVELKAGFTVEQGSVFLAMIEDCAN